MTDYICVLDFEATCFNNSKNHEIIEFPSILLKWENDTIIQVHRIQLYVKPKMYPIVSKFCRELTGITQEIVNQGIPLETAIEKHLSWLNTCSNNQLNKITIVTCGQWDLKTMLPQDLENINNGMRPDKIYTRFVNIKDLFEDVEQCGLAGSMVQMLKYYNLELEGRHHSGLDDCHNIARIFRKLVDNGLTKQIFLKNVIQVQYI